MLSFSFERQRAAEAERRAAAASSIDRPAHCSGWLGASVGGCRSASLAALHAVARLLEVRALASRAAR